MNLTKGEMLKSLGMLNHVDTALPQSWLDWASKYSPFPYDFLLYCCFTDYSDKEHVFGRINTFCTEVKDWLNN